MKPIPKQQIRLSKANIEYALAGSGTPAVILINGGSGPIEGWMHIYHQLAEVTQVLAYNRLGVGASSKPTEPQHGLTVITLLHELLEQLGVQPPYVLVGHSLGGLYANLYVRHYPQEVAGAVLLEASHPSDLAINETQPTVIRAINRLLGLFDGLSAHRKWGEVHFVDETVKQIAQAPDFPDIPLSVVTGGRKAPMMPQEAFDIRQRNQLDYVHLNQHGKQVIASGSGHFPQLTEPDLIRSTIIDCVQTCR